VEGRKFNEIVLTEEDTNRLLSSGCAHLIERTDEGYYRMKLHQDGSCVAFISGRCSIHAVKPTLCRAFPFYVDMFVGLCGVTDCPGFGSGWTKVEDLRGEVKAAKKMYSFWLDRMSLSGKEQLITELQSPAGELNRTLGQDTIQLIKITPRDRK